MQQHGLGWTENFNLTDVRQMQELPQNIPYVPHAPLTNGVFLQQNQFLPKIYGSMQISAGKHCHLFCQIDHPFTEKLFLLLLKIGECQ